MSLAMEIIVALCAFLVIYPIAVYPVALWLISKFKQNPVQENLDYKPEITFIVAAYNEENLIEDCINSILHSNYPKDKIKILAGSDGSTDKTSEILYRMAKENSNLKVFEFNRAGKNRIINELYPIAESEIIGFLDADCRLEENAISASLAKRTDDSIGMVLSSVKILIDPSLSTCGVEGESFYQKYESFLRLHETKIHSNINSLGSFIAIRKDFLSQLPNNKVCDDFYIILNCIDKGKRVLYDNDVVTYEVREKNLKDESSRRVRLVSGGLATIANKKSLLSPKRGWSAFFLWSHKTLRWFIPVYLTFIVIFSAILSFDNIFYLRLITMIFIFISLALAGALAEKFKLNIKPLKLILFFSTMNIGFIRGIFRFIKGRQNSVWDRAGLNNS
jgi:cellulose synthase/poly-beta-1,6-N-acetylglucosamine synthase-like glycosyltransferase